MWFRLSQGRCRLTPRERQVISLLLDGYRIPTIAAALSISEQTVKHHLASARMRTNTEDTIALAVWACRNRGRWDRALRGEI